MALFSGFFFAGQANGRESQCRWDDGFFRIRLGVVRRIVVRKKMELTAMAPMPLDFSVQVRARAAEAEMERSMTPPAVAERILGAVGHEPTATSSAFRVVTPKGRPEGTYFCTFYTFRVLSMQLETFWEAPAGATKWLSICRIPPGNSIVV